MTTFKITVLDEMAKVLFTTENGQYSITVPNHESLEASISSDLQNWLNMAINEQSKSQSKALSKYQFLSRLTVQERVSIFELENTNPMVKMWLEMFRICDEIDLTNSETIQGINMLSQMDILTNERVLELLKPLEL